MTASPFRPLPADGPPQKSGPEAEERVVNTVLDAILGHRVAPGERLIERELADASGAGRMAIRNGLLRLAGAGLVELSPNRGATIASASPEEARQIFEARILIEESALRTLAGRLDEDGKAALEEVLREESTAYEEGRIEQARHASRRFHILFTELAGNRVLARVQRNLVHCQPLVAARRGGRPSLFTGVPAHIRTYAALVRGDGEEAAQTNTGLLMALQRELLLDRGEDDRAARAPEAPG